MEKSKLYMFFGMILFFTVYFVPIWTVTLEAPQYPDPIGLNIWINKISDMNPNDLKNINLMNHYIGMDEIPEYIPEFDFLPLILGGMIFLGLIFTYFNNKKLYLFWFVLMACLGMLGIYDFWLWGHEYGHNLNPNAAIKFVDEFGNPLTYQPPVIGKKTILNFVAVSKPNIGAILIIIGMLMVFLSAYVKEKKIFYQQRMKIKNKIIAVRLSYTLLILPLIYSCSVNAQKINYGEDLCHNCKMHIVDTQHAAQIITKKGKKFIYDSLECMLNEMSNMNLNKNKLYLANTYHGKEMFFNVNNLTFLISKKIPSPMGGNLTAFKNSHDVHKIIKEIGGENYTWEEIKRKYNIIQ